MNFKQIFGFHFLSQIIIVSSPLIVQIYLVRIIDFDLLADIHYILSFYAILQAASSGFSFYFIDQLKKSGLEILPNLLGLSLLINIALSVFFIIFLFYLDNYSLSVLFLLIPLNLSSFSADYYYQYMLKSKFIFYRRLLSRLFLLFLIFISIKEGDDISLYFIIISFIYTFESLLNFWKLPKKNLSFNISVIDISKTQLTASGIVQFFYNQIPNYTILYLGSNSDQFTNSNVAIIILRLFNAGISFVTSFAGIFMVIGDRKVFNNSIGNKYVLNLLFGFMTFLVVNLFNDLINFIFLPNVLYDYFIFFSFSTIFIFHPIINQIVVDIYFATAKYIVIILVYSLSTFIYFYSLDYFSFIYLFPLFYFILFLFFIYRLYYENRIHF